MEKSKYNQIHNTKKMLHLGKMHYKTLNCKAYVK